MEKSINLSHRDWPGASMTMQCTTQKKKHKFRLQSITGSDFGAPFQGNSSQVLGYVWLALGGFT